MTNINIETTNVEPDRKYSSAYLIYSIVLSLFFIGVATNFYYTLLDVETFANCTSVPTAPFRDVDNFCDYRNIWKLCGFCGIFFPGCLVIIYASVTLRMTKDCLTSFPVWPSMFGYLLLMTNGMNTVVLIILWASNVASTHIVGTYSLAIAAELYMASLGLELAVLLIAFFCEL